MNYADRVLKCRDCGRDFGFTAGEQEFYASRGLMNDPARCPECRALRRQRPAPTSGDYATDARGSRPRREMHPAVCAECGAETMVPFVPRNDRPVYCSACYDRIRSQR